MALMGSATKSAGKVLSGRFVKQAALIAVGALGSRRIAQYARNNIVDLSVRGADAAYSMVAAAITLAVAPGSLGRPAALGMVAGGFTVAAEDFL